MVFLLKVRKREIRRAIKISQDEKRQRQLGGQGSSTAVQYYLKNADTLALHIDSIIANEVYLRCGYYQKNADTLRSVKVWFHFFL